MLLVWVLNWQACSARHLQPTDGAEVVVDFVSPPPPPSCPQSFRPVRGREYVIALRELLPTPDPVLKSKPEIIAAERQGLMSGTVDNTFRRKWNREEYIERAREAEKEEEDERDPRKPRGPPIQRKPLKHRDYEVDLTSRLGKTQAGYFCSVCECVVKDSANYLDHINGKKHQRALGMSMRVERATLQQVQDRFGSLKRKKDAPSFSEQDLDLRILKQQQEEEERKKQRKEKKKEKKREKPTRDDGVDEFDMDMAATMGFGGFGTSKK